MENLIGSEEREREFFDEGDDFYPVFLGLVTKLAGLSLFIAVVFVLFEPQMSLWSRPADYQDVKKAIQKITAAQAIYLERSPGQQYGTLSQLLKSGYLHHEMRSELWRGYCFEVQTGPNPSENYWVKVSPLDPSIKNACYWFYSPTTNIHRSSTDFTVNTENCFWNDDFTMIRGR